jgi:hypothetical protein
MNLKTFITALFLSIFLTAIIQSLTVSSTEKDSSFIAVLLISLFVWRIQDIIIHIVLFALYFYIIDIFITNKKFKFFFYVLVFISGIISFGLAVVIDWGLSRPVFKTFRDYVYGGSHYSLYILLIILVLSITGVIKFRRISIYADKALKAGPRG